MKRFFLTFVLVAILAVAASSSFAQQPAQNAPATTVVVANDWSALDQPVDTTYTKSHSATLGLQAVVAEIRATLSSLVQQFRALVARVDQNDADIAAIRLQLGMTDDKKPGAGEDTGTTETAPVAPATGSESGTTTAPAPAPADDSTQKTPAQAGAGATSESESGDKPGDGKSDISGTTTSQSEEPKAGTPTLGEKLRTDVDNLATNQNLLTVLVLIALVLHAVALYRALLAARRTNTLAGAAYIRLGNGQPISDGGTFPSPDELDSPLVAAWIKNGGTLPADDVATPAEPGGRTL